MPDEGSHSESRTGVKLTPTPTLCTAQVDCASPTPIETLKALLGQQDLAVLFLFVCNSAPFSQIVAKANNAFPDTNVVACTTAGEIGMHGYEDGLIVAVGLPADHFAATCLMIDPLNDIDTQSLIDKIALTRVTMERAQPDKPQGFAFLVVDGLSLKEDVLTATISPALRDLPLFGGSAGDGTTFERTQVALNGQVRSNAAVLTLVRTDHQTRVFSLNHLVPTGQRMVVTDADPDKRIVKSINAEPAAQEYARIVGKDPAQLDQFTFAAHPVVVRIGGTHHVRAIQRVNTSGELVFFSAIDEGMVLTVAEPLQMAPHLDQKLSELSDNGPPSDIIGCDCILRRIEAAQIQMTRDVSTILSKHHVLGFSTYGEQIGALHVNHTMTGVALYPARGDVS